jgi:TetR/AcrR family transcriptional repressor of nem operon
VSRPRSFSTVAAVEAAKNLFWDRGYEGATISDLERATGLNRSSLYTAFGSKEALFERALGEYIESFADPLLAPMERPGAGVESVVGFFASLAAMFRGDTMPARHGCLWVNSVAECAGRPGLPDALAAHYRQRLHRAFGNALAGGAGQVGGSADRIDQRARVLAGATIGVWLAARIDATEAAAWCDAVVAEIRLWSSPAQTTGEQPLSLSASWRIETERERAS